jgi:hypothetical protein
LRIPILPLSLVLVAGIFFYTALQGNRSVLEATDERPMLAFATATDLAAQAQGNAVRYWRDLGRWPQTFADVNLDQDWMSRHRGIDSIRYGRDGAVLVSLDAATDGPATLIAWTPREDGERILWDCESDLADIATHIEDCTVADQATLVELEADSAGDDPAPDAEPMELAGLDERCQAMGAVAYGAARARSEGEELDTFISRPVVAFVDDPNLRAELEALARWVYESPVRTPNAMQRDVLQRYRCLKS